ncbi:DNA-binding MarR family transcriptional regulator [Isoptericola sp. CG 20/1183]|uniref:DNA-binding MarR family transcriptional regulator n=1 Tax=Isoptericola halotolerans TaxID=300560 RepID=A0ABX5EFA1_9MICO|nr:MULTISPECIES: MarR family transcriptional regulator [Isoptericola]PRZ08083.1 DNA-binding MarR family transcriptional regulator [Isoptericola halotolerans]PRZ08881.1 DNA-binding MarR family transcriptional regulator [Isoptericola sp. CG 20/1183]
MNDDPARLSSDLRVALTRAARRLRTQRGEADLPEGQFGVLAVLDRHGEMSPGALAEHERVRPPAMTRAVTALAELGLVAKIDHPTDKRQVVVRLTDAGRHEIAETRRRRDAWLTCRLEELDADERATLAAATEILVRVAAG